MDSTPLATGAWTTSNQRPSVRATSNRDELKITLTLAAQFLVIQTGPTHTKLESRRMEQLGPKKNEKIFGTATVVNSGFVLLVNTPKVPGARARTPKRRRICMNVATDLPNIDLFFRQLLQP